MICPRCNQPGVCVIGNFFTGCGCDKEEISFCGEDEKIGYVVLALIPEDYPGLWITSLERARKDHKFFSSSKIFKVSYDTCIDRSYDGDTMYVTGHRTLEIVE